ncbi:MAG: acetolactate synthase large subunit [Anaerolineales bacterium]|nr:acetolactate synthase large subunit [Anaerolineales bacterium]
MNGAQNLIKTLVAADVNVCFTNPGTSEMHFVAALDQVEGMRAVLGLFEGVCTGAADGYARMTGRPASTLLHLGPGLGNGLANLHNAKRALSPMVNIVGEHATYHIQHDAPLTSPIEQIAWSMSHWVRTSMSPDNISRDTAAAITAARTAPGQIATLILPGDSSWDPTTAPIITPTAAPQAQINQAAVQNAAAVLRSGEPTLLLLSGKAVLDDGLRLVSQISQATGVPIMSNRPTARLQMGAGRPLLRSLAYPLPQSLAQLEEFAHIILVSTAEPVAFFAYPGQPSRLEPAGCQIHTLATPAEDVVGALAALADELGLAADAPLSKVEGLDRPGLPSGELTPNAIWQSVAAQLPEEAIIVNEAITSGAGAGTWLRNLRPFDMLTGTGGSIGHGLPQAVGAAVACPDRQVVGMQADGSAMYTIQALWTQAREQLNVVTVLFNNRSYEILRGEMSRVGAMQHGSIADTLFSLDNPQLDFVSIAQGLGVEGSRATTAEAFNDQFAAALAKRGPHLIEVLV